MKILLDENLPHRLRGLLPGHEVSTVAYMGWNGVQNGELLDKAAQAGFEALLTKDNGMPYQHDAAKLAIAIVVLRAKTNSLRDLQPLVPELLEALSKLPPRAITWIG